MSKCLICYEDVKNADYHEKCAKRFFQTHSVPLLPYKIEELKEIAKNEIRESCANITGVQKKISLGVRKSKKERRLTFTNVWGRFILKPPADRYPEMPQVEHLSMMLAEAANIQVVPYALIRLASGELAYISRRIDRPKDGGKIHMEDMCQLTERLTEDKYKGSMENIAKAIRQYSSAPMLDIVRFFELAIHSFLIGNADMHLKNFSLIMKDPEKFFLSPAYDLLSTRLLIPESVDSEEMALPICGKKKKLSGEDFYIFGENINLTKIQIKNAINLFLDRLEIFYEIIDKSFLTDDMKNEFKGLIKSRALRLRHS